MKPIVSFFSVPVIGNPELKNAANGSKFITFAVKSDAYSKKRGEEARIMCFDTNPLFERVMRMKIRSGSIVNMTCAYKMMEKPAINPDAWRGLLTLCENVHVQDPALAAFLRGKKPDEPPTCATAFFDVLSIDYALEHRAPGNGQQCEWRPPEPPQKPLTMSGF